ncbi:hypothetical protein GMOD_00005604 [Pyrenophora seminiperda CCB06]|uniref:Uncharacterized protein n=1 Tax=Pyrenophora seminiperda CCB06 TaxID=1302712 RepID=A0A3M7M9H9_9PLEO|nr:hypothetical protein GMOD_00005604 [Pyrenophora seminiperda CCB06]
MSNSIPNRSNSASNQDDKKSTNFHQRKDSYQDDLSTSPKLKQDEETNTTTTAAPSIKQEQPHYPPISSSLPIHPNAYLDSLKQETLYPAFTPIYPWISPPRPLPGPYDAPYYPLPLPTLQQTEQSFQAATEAQDPAIKSEGEEEEGEQLEAALYARHLLPPHSSIQEHETVLQGAVIASNKGWRRTQWTVLAR